MDGVKVDAEKVCKGLECCTSAKHPIPCGMCDYYGNNEYNDFWSCRISLMRDAFALINAQQEKIKDLEDMCSDLDSKLDWYIETYEE